MFDATKYAWGETTMQKEKKEVNNEPYEMSYKELMRVKVEREWRELPEILREIAETSEILTELYHFRD
jgi:hypothetical protein